ncbi:uncharacterized protein MELLADRAFT_111180 [Melampsora larici-populina 98AG31]|uniref:Uncharacterized protein n=1 Tax=Melampsora larici-populina (strain 98AG31 / pathotype 3-4-7) TaxID=747676 RepID=F4S2A4_MELLP|nr:uncharacterized protein MELLADRAFT_111180 [Melampsora larici-populina 98AG31]EGG01237.1 hypothetical protein MELLADRAFT_111180 [Melampsora larici-populina 98AG31]
MSKTDENNPIIPKMTIPTTISNQQPSNKLLEHVSNQLISIGHLRKPLDSNSLQTLDGQEKLFKAIFSLITSHQGVMKRKEDELDKEREMRYEFDRLGRLLEVSQSEKTKSMQLASTNQSKMSAALKALEEEKNSHRKTKEDMNKLINSEKLIRSSCSQEIKRRSQEVEEFQKRMNKLSNSTHQVGKIIIGSQIMSTNSSINGDQHGYPGSESGRKIGLLELELQGAYKVRDKIIGENKELRKYLRLYEKSISDLVDEVKGGDEPSLDVIDEDDEDGQAQQDDGMINDDSTHRIPLTSLFKRMSRFTYELREKVIGLKDLLNESIANNEDIKQKMEMEKTAVSEGYELRIDELGKEIERLKSALVQTEEVVEGWIRAGLNQSNGMMDHGIADDVEESIVIPSKVDNPTTTIATTTTTDSFNSKKREIEETIEKQKRERLMEYEEKQKQILAEIFSPEKPTTTTSTIPNPIINQTIPEENQTSLDSLIVFTKPTNLNKKLKGKEIIGKTKSSSTIKMKKIDVPSTTSRFRREPMIPSSSRSTLNSVLAMTDEKEGKATAAGNEASGSGSSSNPKTKAKAKVTPAVPATATAPSSTRINRFGRLKSRVPLNNRTKAKE